MYVPFLHLPRSSIFTGCEPEVPLDVNSTVSQPQLVGDPDWTGLAAYSVATTPDVSAIASD